MDDDDDDDRDDDYPRYRAEPAIDEPDDEDMSRFDEVCGPMWDPGTWMRGGER